jgi:signal transduction histidine kinase
MKARILVVEDSATQAEMLCGLLEEQYATTLARSGEQALQCLATEEFSLVISDVMMPGISGYELCRRIKADPAVEDVPVILLTSLHDPMDIVRGLEAGADNYVTKPYDPEHLLTRIDHVLTNRRLRRNPRTSLGVSISFLGNEFTITSDKEQILDLLLSSVEDVIRANEALQRAKEEADHANRAKSEFLSRMSHELRTPLNAILGFGQLLELSVSDREDRESVQEILRAGKHLLGLVDEVLDIARIEAGRVSLSLEPVAVQPLIEETLSMLRPLASQRDIALYTATELGTLHARADRQRLKQVLLNLLSNAIKYNRDGGVVVVSCAESSPERVRIQVKDTGPGIAPDDQPHLFAPFHRLPSGAATIPGTGLGLAISKGLIEAMEGTIGVESTKGEGSTFWFELPLAEGVAISVDSAPAVKTMDAMVADAHPQWTQTVLYIEDDVANLRLVERVMARRPRVRLLTAMQGWLGLDLATQHHPDLILLDLHLPDVHGVEILQRLKADPTTACVPVVILSADATPGQAERLRTLGAQGFLAKPLDIQHLLGLVDEHHPEPSDS